MSFPSVKRLALLLFVVLPIVAWAIVKPVRVVAPELVGISCRQLPVCVDDPSQLSSANQLYVEGLSFVSSTISPGVFFAQHKNAQIRSALVRVRP